jgi:hypothetical protein
VDLWTLNEKFVLEKTPALLRWGISHFISTYVWVLLRRCCVLEPVFWLLRAKLRFFMFELHAPRCTFGVMYELVLLLL